jgi:hypothetical protein
MSKKNNEFSAEELTLAMILEQRRKLREEGKDPDVPVITPELQKAFNDI